MTASLCLPALPAAVALLFLLAVPAGAEGPPGEPEGVMPELFNVEAMVQKIIDGIARNPEVRDWFRRIGALLAAVFFLYNLYIAMATGQASLVSDSIFRAAVVGAVLTNLPSVAEVITSFHGAMAALGDLVFNELGGADAMDRALARLGEARSKIMEAIRQRFDLWALPAFLSSLVMTVIPMIVMMLFVAVAAAIYQFLAMGSYLMLAFAVLMTPISVAFLATRSMQRFTYEWLQAVMHSALVILFAKAAVGIVVGVTFLGPIEQYADRVIEAAKKGPEHVLEEAVMDPRNFVHIVIGAIVGIFTLMNVQGIASAFVGRVESVAGAIAGMYAAAARFAPRGR